MRSKPTLLSPMAYGKYCTVRMPNGKEYERVVRYSRDLGLYVVIATKKYSMTDMKIGREIKNGH